MPRQREALRTPPSSLAEHLQDVTETLAAARTQDEVFGIVLRPALQALGAIAGAVLLVDKRGETLVLAGTHGYAAGAQTIWQDGPLDGNVPAGDALSRKQALFFEQGGDLHAAYPELEARIGTRASVASAVVPMFLDRQPLGTIVLDFHEPHRFTPGERRFLRTLGAQCVLALGRMQLSSGLERQVQERTAALDAFVAFTEAVGSETDVLALARQVTAVVRASLEHVSVAYYQLDGDLWKARVWSEDLPEAVVAQIRAGVRTDAPAFAEAMRSEVPVFVDGWDAEANQVPSSASYGAAAFIPIFMGGEAHGLFSAGTREARVWNERERSVVRAVARGLSLALERAGAARQLKEQNQELAAKTRVLEGFAELTRDLTLDIDPRALVRRAQQVVLTLIPDGYTLYYERDGDRWRNTVQTGEVGDAGLQAFIDQGPRVGRTPSVDIPWTTRAALYQDEYAKGSDTDAALVQHVSAAATLPVLVNGESVGVFVACVFEQRPWLATERAVLETMVRSLGLALERAEQARQLDEERAALAAFTTYTEMVGSETDVSLLIGRAMSMLQEMRAVDVRYFQREADRFVLHVSTDEQPGELRSRSRQGYSPQLPSIALAARERDAVFLDNWDAGEQGIPETAVYRAVALQPFFQGETMTSVLVMACRDRSRWTERDRGIFRAVGRSLSLALERAEQARQLVAQRDTLDARTQALVAANEELEAFTYSASHDLRTPVRHVMSFAGLARQSLTPPNEKASRYLDVVQQAAERMTSLIDAMLILSRTGREELRPRPVALDALVAQAQRDVRTEFPDQPVSWQLQPLPQIWGDAGLLQQVITNLISNAVKYSNTREISEVGIWAQERDGEWVISVRDNGVGFDPAYAQKLFGVFQRLHSQRDFEGVGVGLATVRRIVLKHGGQVFTLPRRD